jgi:hypothetical protein
MSQFELTKGIIEYRRKTTPPYRDIRDRTTWELLDVLWWNNDFLFPIDPANREMEGFNVGLMTGSAFSANGVSGGYCRRLLRKGEGGVNFYDGTREFSKLEILFNTRTNNSFQILQDMRFAGPNNSQSLHANGLTTFENLAEIALTLFPSVFNVLEPAVIEAVLALIEANQTGERVNELYNLSVTAASGSWSGATNVLIDPQDFDPVNKEVPVRIFRALN